MAFNLDKVGRPICKIEGTGKYNNKILSLFMEGEGDDEIKKKFNSLKLDSAKFQQIPDTDKEREIIYITGPSGSGKSTYSANYIKQYKKNKKGNEIYLFSALPEDDSLDEINPKRILIDDRLITEPLKAEDFKDSLVIFDDIDVISNKKHRDEVYKILNQILEVGRHYNCSCILTNHLPTNGKDTRRILNECHSITYFPHSGGGRGMKYLLTEYLGLDKKMIKKIKNSKSRWATIFKNYPQICMTEKDIFLMSEDE